jgi:RNA polymerase sigma-70 factor (ECF subfamily)
MLRPLDSARSGERERRMRLLVRANEGPLHRYLLRLAHGRREVAEDLLQETMLRAWRGLDRLPEGRESARRWLFTVARNLAIDAARAQSSRPAEVAGADITWIPVAGDVADIVTERHALRHAMKRLTPEQRAVLDLLYFRGASVAEAAVHFGVPEGTIRSRSFYALRRMRSLLETEKAR